MRPSTWRTATASPTCASDGVADLRDPHGGIEFRHLTFRYPDGEYDVLKDVSFTIKPGESVGIVGKTGAGKTALVDLLLRTYNVPDGTLFVDGQDVNAVSIHSVRDACAYVPQGAGRCAGQHRGLQGRLRDRTR